MRESRASKADPYRELFERSADAILIIEGETFIDCNAATVQMLRYDDKAQLLKTHPSELSPPTQPDGRDSYEKANEMMAIAFRQGSHRFEWLHMRADGDVFPVEVLLTHVRREEREFLHVVWRDISDRKRLEEGLRHAQKMEAVGKLAGGIAHDFNNLLVAVLGHAEFLSELLADKPQALLHVNEIARAGDRAAELVRKLLAFGRKQERRVRVLDLNALIRDLSQLLARLIGEDLRLESVLAEGELPVSADQGQIEQVVVNLAANARDAMSAGGTLTLSTSRRCLAGSEDAIGVAVAPGEYAVLRVSDTGEGIDPKSIGRVFEPYFSTKAPEKGSGLGLATVHGIVEQSGGHVRIESELGVGTTVEIFLPLSPLPLTSPTPSVPAESLQAVVDGTTILVVEDDPAVSGVVVEILRGHGYGVLLAENGQQGVELYSRCSERIALVLSDVIMPTLSGPEMIEALRKQGHEPPALFMSGYTSENLARFRDGDPDFDLLPKPFTPKQLLYRVQRVLARTRSRSTK